jgi:hypothetical protein
VPSAEYEESPEFNQQRRPQTFEERPEFSQRRPEFNQRRRPTDFERPDFYPLRSERPTVDFIPTPRPSSNDFSGFGSIKPFNPDEIDTNFGRLSFNQRPNFENTKGRFPVIANFEQQPELRPPQILELEPQRPSSPALANQIDDFNVQRPKRQRRPPIFQQVPKRFHHERPTQYVDYRANPRPQKRKRFEGQNVGGQQRRFHKQGQRTTTPRPIPTPGPFDFPRPPPRRARPPPTHPTHPPPITHPPEHYESVTRSPLGFPILSNEVDDNDDYSYDDNSEDGFFEIPESFPNLDDLGGGFGMRIRNKRSLNVEDANDEISSGFKKIVTNPGNSGVQIRPRRSNLRYTMQVDPMMVSESRIRRRNRRRFPAENSEGRFRRNHNNQAGRQGGQVGFGFPKNFWDDANVDTADFFNNYGGGSAGGSVAENYGQRNPGLIRRERYTVPNYQNQNSGGGYERPDPYTEQTIQSYPEDSYNQQQQYNSNVDNSYTGYAAINNEILGSGNFEVINGGTYYDDDTYYYSAYNKRPQHGEQLFENFRDFADIKNDLYTYPKYR